MIRYKYFASIAACSDSGIQTDVINRADGSGQFSQSKIKNDAFYLAENGVTVIFSDAEVGE